jgi:2-methylcitrate dehydratase
MQELNRSDPYLVDELGRFVAAADMSHVSEGALRSLKRNVLDSLGCAIAADGDVITAILEQVESVGAAAPVATLVGAGAPVSSRGRC